MKDTVPKFQVRLTCDSMVIDVIPCSCTRCVGLSSAYYSEKNTSSANVWSHNIGLAPLLLLLGKRFRQLVPFENEIIYTEN